MCKRQGLLRATVAAGLIAASLWACAVFAQAPAPKYLSTDLAERLSSIVMGWGELGVDTSVNPVTRPAMKLRIKDKEYKHGLGHHATGEIVVDLGGQFQTFEAEVGVQWQGGQDQATVIFRVFVDDKKVFDSGVMREGDAPRPIKLSVAGAQEMTLVADDAGDGITCDCANWADARLTPDPTAARRPAARGLDIAPFGHVATWDAKRTKGTAADRVQEMPAEDIQMYRDLLPEAGGGYRVPLKDGAGCIGLRWDENRMLRQVSLAFADAAAVPPRDKVQLQAWTGESAWQGSWQPAGVAAEKIENSLVWNFDSKHFPRGTQKVRFVFSGQDNVPVVRGVHAYSRSRWISQDIRIESTRPGSGTVDLALYNGQFVDPAGATAKAASRTWETAKPLTLRVCAAVTKRYKADRTVLRFQFPDTAFGIAIEDLAANDCVYVPHAGLFVTREPAPITCAQYPRKIAGKKTLLEQVRRQPDQTFARAMAVVHNPIQDLGPMMISLACDCRKFVAFREGTLQFDSDSRFDGPERPIPMQWQLVPRFGSGKDLKLSRHLAGKWLPMPTTTAVDGKMVYRECSYVAPVDEKAPAGSPAWVRDQAVGVMEFSVKNEGTQEGAASLALTLAAGQGNAQKVVWEQTPQGIVAKAGDRLLALLDVGKLAPAEVKLNGATLVVSGNLPPGGTAAGAAYVPAWPATAADVAAVLAAAPFGPRVESYWNAVLAPAIKIELPDELLTNVIRASQVHCLLAARSEDGGRRVSPWISSDRYGPLESEANSIVRGMGLMGHDEFARRCFDYFIHRYNKEGYLTTGYTMVGTGEHLWTLGEHYQRVPDEPWLRANAAKIARASKWIAAQRAKTKRFDASGRRSPEYGLFPPGVTADWNRYAYRFYNDAQYCAGLEAAARMLAAIGHPDAPSLADDARQYREDLLRAYRDTQARSPVVRLDDGTWVPADPALLDCPGRVEDFLPGEDGNRSWCYSVEIGAHHLAANRVLDPMAAEVGWMMNYLEESQFLRSGMGDYPEERNRKDPFNLGGFAKVQPYYGRIAEVYAGRDDVKPFIRSYFNAIPAMLSRENLSFWEHFHNIAGWNKTHETGWFLCQTRIMLVDERGDELWLAPFATDAWLRDGGRIAVAAAPTGFGHVGYTIESAAAQGQITATIDPPTRKPPRRIVLRVRHPDGKPMQSVTVNGQPHQDFDPRKETVTLVPAGGKMQVRVTY